MRFGAVPLAEAEGAILAHSVQLTSGRLRKGIVLGPDDLAGLAQAGHAEVTVARLGPDDVHEDAAAQALAEAVLGGGALRLGTASTGRVNVIAEGPGVAQIDAARINAANAIDPMVTIATVPEWQRMEPGGLVATIKIISYGVGSAALERAVAACSGAIGLCAPAYGTAVLIETSVGQTVTDKGMRALYGRLESLDIALAAREVVPHAVAPLTAALRGAKADVVFVLTSSATSDIADVAPSALVAAGGQVETFGMPVDPGNLLFLGSLGDRPVIGLPGCARSPALNGADWVLERVLCGVPVTRADIMAMGVGGLLKEIPTRPRPRRA